MRMGALVVLAAALSACTSTKMVQREGCWVRQTERIFGQVDEQLGLCARDAPKWADDRLTRLVQECMAQADYRWQNRALAAWTRNEPLPAEIDEREVLRSCLNETATSAVAENEGLKSRLGELTADRTVLQDSFDQQLAHLRSNHEAMTAALGEAARRETPSAIATATSNGTATTQSDSTLQSPASAGAPVALAPICGSQTHPPSTVASSQKAPASNTPDPGVGGSGEPSVLKKRVSKAAKAPASSTTADRSRIDRSEAAATSAPGTKSNKAGAASDCEPLPKEALPEITRASNPPKAAEAGEDTAVGGGALSPAP